VVGCESGERQREAEEGLSERCRACQAGSMVVAWCWSVGVRRMYRSLLLHMESTESHH
jgi:hypothetical protein